MTTTKSTAKIAARKKIAAAAMALGMGVLGTGFAAGTISFDIIGENGFGQGQSADVRGAGQSVDITGQLTIDRPQTVNVDQQTGVATATLDENLHITGWENLTNSQGATYRILVKTDGDNRFIDLSDKAGFEATEGTVPTGGEILVPAKYGNNSVKELSIVVEK